MIYLVIHLPSPSQQLPYTIGTRCLAINEDVEVITCSEATAATRLASDAQSCGMLRQAPCSPCVKTSSPFVKDISRRAFLASP